MKEFDLKKDSWHYKTAQFGETRVCDETDICEYVRAVIKGGALFLFLASVGAGIAGSLLYALGNLFGFLFLDYELTKFSTGVLVVTGTVLGVALVALASVAIKVKMNEWSETVEQKEPGFLRLAYTKFKDKTCFKINLK